MKSQHEENLKTLEQKCKDLVCFDCRAKVNITKEQKDEFLRTAHQNLGAWNKVVTSSYCDKCKKAQEIKKQEEEKEHIKNLIQHTLPPRYHNIISDRPVDKHLDDSLYITGDVGTGKTVFMATLAKKNIMNRRAVRWILYPEFIMLLQNSYKNEIYKKAFYNESVKVNPFNEASQIADFEGILYIDDLGAEKLTEFVRQTTYYIINHREQHMLQTVITSNFSLDEIDSQIDRRVSSRIAGMCNILKFKGSDLRLKKQIKEAK